MSQPIKPVILDFEKPLVDLEHQIQALEAGMQGLQSTHSEALDPAMAQEIAQLKRQAQAVKAQLYHNLTPAQRIQIARHPQRPNFLEVVQGLSPEMWFELHGDRGGCDDRAIIGGLIELDGQPVMVVGTQKGRGMKENLVYNFGMANPEGYRKALRLFAHAEKFHMPVLTMIDTPGAYPGIHGEQYGIGQAIALNLREMSRLKTPIISVVLGEGASGGALGIGVADRIWMLEHAVYTVISPEGCASILWRDAAYAAQAADALKITAQDLLGFGMIDGIIPEPQGGAHNDPEATVADIRAVVMASIHELKALDTPTMLDQRYQKFRTIGVFNQ
jgi:acetyl-CoA carboxylase carboxyl transferase subunit alpha